VSDQVERAASHRVHGVENLSHGSRSEYGTACCGRMNRR
jgi:hypothetical protein